ncbi:MAG TPA: hypothetical protein VHG32_25255 [Thermoanaerobaculia bacterium]|jgi:hypothetical protein|nr:hypothetical protein [Thermoanaerobaculia bacterium]
MTSLKRQYKYHEPDLYGDGTYSCELLERDEHGEWKAVARTPRVRTQRGAILLAREWVDRREAS